MLELLLKTLEANNNMGIIGKQNTVFSLMLLHCHVMCDRHGFFMVTVTVTLDQDTVPISVP